MCAFDMQEAMRRADEVRQNQAKFHKTPFMQLKQGLNPVRIIPPFGDRKLWWIEYKQAWLPFTNGKKIPVVPRAQFGLPDCPLQEKIDALHRNGDPTSKKEADSLRPKSRFHFWVLDRADEAAGPKLLSLPIKSLLDFQTIMSDPEFGDISHYATGVDIVVNYTPATKTSFAEYRINPKRNSTPLHTDPVQMQALLSEDLFAKYRVGEATEADFLQAIVDGTVDQFIAAKKAKGQTVPIDDEGSVPDTQAPPTLSAGNSRYKCQTTRLLSERFWVVVDGNPVLKTAAEVCDMVAAGSDPQIITEDQSSGWTVASRLGFQRIELAPPPPPVLPPPPPVTPPKLPPPVDTVPFAIPGEEEAALEAQLRAMGNKSQVASDLLSMVGK